MRQEGLDQTFPFRIEHRNSLMTHPVAHAWKKFDARREVFFEILEDLEVDRALFNGIGNPHDSSKPNSHSGCAMLTFWSFIHSSCSADMPRSSTEMSTPLPLGFSRTGKDHSLHEMEVF
jgi:hypothetical protein